eukprot:c40840_g1_i1 orf=85-243(+)
MIVYLSLGVGVVSRVALASRLVVDYCSQREDNKEMNIGKRTVNFKRTIEVDY